MPLTWQFALDYLHPVSTAVRNRLGTTDRRLLARALQVAPRTYPGFPFLLRQKTTQGFGKPYLLSIDAHEKSSDGIDNQFNDGTATSALVGPLSTTQFQKRKVQAVSRLERLSQYLEETSEGAELQDIHVERPRRVTEARPTREGLQESVSVDDYAATEATTRRSQARGPARSMSSQHSVQENLDTGATSEQLPPPFAQSREKRNEEQLFGDSPQVELTEDPDWHGISYVEAMESLDFEQTPTVTENPNVPHVSSEAEAALENSVDSSRCEQTTIQRDHMDVPEFKDHMGTPLVPQTIHSPEVDHTKAEQQDELPIVGSTASESQGSLVAALFPEMASATENEKENAGQEDDLSENPDDLVAALFPEMKNQPDTPSIVHQTTHPTALTTTSPVPSEALSSLPKPSQTGEAIPENQNELMDQLLPEPSRQQAETKPDNHQQDQPLKSILDSSITIAAGEEQQVCAKSAPKLDAVTRNAVARDLKYSDAVSDNAGGLLHRLFPEEANKNRKEVVKVDQQREPPRMRLDPAAGPIVVRHFSGEIKKPRDDHPYIVNLQAVSPRLTEEDIRGLLPPSSAHIEGWTSEYIKTIPLRDPITLDRKEAYYIMFRSVHGGIQFKKRLRNLHELLLKMAPTSMLSPRTHPLRLTDPKTGEDMSLALKLFSLGPPRKAGQIYAPTLQYPWLPEVARLIHNGGYPQVIDRAHGIEAKVLMHFDGTMQPTKYEVCDAIRADGHDRGVPWDIPGGERGGPTVVPGVVQLSTARRDDAHSDVTSLMRKLPPRWLISFRSKPEAHRFVRRWHRRPFPWQPKQYAEYGEDMPIARAEVLW